MIKKLLSCVREYTAASVLTPVFMVGEVAMEVTIPFLMASLIDKGITAGDMNYIGKMGIILVLCAFVALALGVLSGVFGAKASSGFAKNIRRDMYYNVQNFSFSNIDKFSSASIVTRLTTDITNLQMAYLMILRLAVRSPVMLVLSLIMAFTVSGKLALIYLGAVPVLGVGLFLIIRHVHPIFEKIFRTYDKLNNRVQENVRGIRVVKSFVREDYEVSRFKEVSETIYKNFVKAEKRIAFNAPLMQFCMYACMILVAWIGAKLIVGGSLTTGELMSVITYAMQILMSLMMLSMVFVMIIISRASAERVVEILNEQPDIVNKENPVTSVKDGSVSFCDVSFSYSGDKNKPCLSNVKVDIAAGETVGIIGGTGSSKTSLVQLIPRLYDVTCGSVMVGGVDVRDYELETLREAVAVVLQKNVLFSGTIKENLRWGNENATDEEIERVCKLAQADEFIRSFPNGYDTHIEQGGANVSGGQKQRLCIARALLKNPKVLILDDSTSAVDTRTEALIRGAFMDEIPGTTKFIISQRVSSVQDADKIIVMEGGMVNAVGTHEELLATNAIYCEVYHSQTKGGDFDEAN